MREEIVQNFDGWAMYRVNVSCEAYSPDQEVLWQEEMERQVSQIVEKEFTRAPNYAEIAKLNPEHINSDSIQYSGKVIELSDERIVEIGQYFKEFILETESKLDYFTYED